jgi:hemerythrin
MAVMKWEPALSVGVPALDGQHQKLIQLVNKLHDAMSKGVGQKVVGEVLDELVAYTKDHFAAEEQMMKRHAYPDFTAHAAEHLKLVGQVGKLQADAKSGKVLTITVMDFLQQWLTGHILKVDRKYTPYLVNRVA